MKQRAEAERTMKGKILLSLHIIFIPLLLVLAAGCGSSLKPGPEIRIENVRSRPPRAIEDELGGMGAVYLTIFNDGGKPDRLLGVRTDVAEKVEIHTGSMENGKMTMKPGEGGIEIPAKGKFAFETGRYHIMLIRLKCHLTEGDKFKVVLEFEKSGLLEVEAEVRQE